MNTPKITSRLYKPFDWFGWVMCILGLALMCKFGGVGGVFGTDKNWWLFALTFMLFAEYMFRVALGRIYKFVYYDTIIHRLYEIEVVDGNIFYVCAENGDELDLYMETHYPEMTYTILKDTHAESFIKTEQFT
jgi:hypothetical protein